MDKRIKIYMGLPSLGDMHQSQMYALRDMEKFYGDKLEFVYPKHFVGRIFHDYARNMIVEDFLKTDCDVLWFLDSDVSPPNTAVELITKHWDKWKVAGCPYPIFLRPQGHDQPKVVFAVYDNGFHHAAIPPEGLDFIDGIATGCLFIKRELLEAMPKPYFEFKYDAETREMTQGEDLGFCRKIAELGHKFFIDYSMLCNHFKRVNLLDVNNYAINEFNERWMEQDRFMRSQIAEIKLGIKKAKESPILHVPKSKLILP